MRKHLAIILSRIFVLLSLPFLLVSILDFINTKDSINIVIFIFFLIPFSVSCKYLSTQNQKRAGKESKIEHGVSKHNHRVLSSQPAQKGRDVLTPIESPPNLPVKTDDFKEWHIKVLRRLDGHSKSEPFTGLISKEVDIPKFIPILEQLNLITTSSYTESLALMKTETLKQILRENNLQVSGNKQALIERLMGNVCETNIKKISSYKEFYKLTSTGQKLVDDSYARFESEHVTFFKDVVTKIMSCKPNDAYKMICKRNAEMPTPHGIGCNWHERYYSGLDSKLEQKYIQRLRSSESSFTTSVAIYSEMSGDSYHNIDKWISKAFPNIQSSEVDFRTESHIFSINKELEALLDCGVEKYQFLATLDTETCPICGKLDGKKFLISDAIIGKNCPPMHKGCRCTIVACLSPTDSSEQRRARNPQTGKNELVPASLTYSQWKKQYLKQ